MSNENCYTGSLRSPCPGFAYNDNDIDLESKILVDSYHHYNDNAIILAHFKNSPSELW